MIDQLNPHMFDGQNLTQYQYLMISMGMNGQNHMFNGQNCQTHS